MAIEPEDLLPHFERELGLLRRSTRAFAELYPKIAARLAMSGEHSDDPHVERLLQSFALMCARHDIRLEDEVPEFTHALINTIHGAFLRPFPSCAMAQFRVDRDSKQTEPRIVPRGTQLVAPNSRLVFRTATDVTLVPLTVSAVRYATSAVAPMQTTLPSDTTGILSFTLELTAASAQFSITPDMLRLHLAGEREVVAALADGVLMHATRAFVELDGNGRWRRVDMPLAAAGFDDADALLPPPRDNTTAPFHLLMEYGAFPARFDNLDLDLARLKRLAGGARRITLHLALAGVHPDSRRAQRLIAASADNLRLFCTPVVNILTEIFQDHGFTDFEFDIRTAQKPLEYIVMYQESYYNFCARLMEQEGLIWTHRYEKEKHFLVIGDTNFVFRPIDGLANLPYAATAASEDNGIDQLHEGRRFGVGKIAFRDFNHQNPSSPLMLAQAEPENLRHAGLETTERFEHQSLFDHGDDGDRYARIAMQAEEASAHRYTGTGYAWRMTTAGSVTVSNHPVMANNQEYAILHVRHEAVNDYTEHNAKLPYRNTFSLLPKKFPYRSPRNTPKPVIHGTQSAIVVGPKGEEIHTNGSAVKVHFLWDRRGKLDGSDSMWIRVSQPWAGDGWGAAAIPRINQEVLVAFNQGDPDNPVIVGRVYNGEQGNPYHGAAGQTMGIKSQTHKGAGSNELRFSDVNGAQEVFLHAQKDMNTVIKDSETHTVEAGGRTVSLLKGSETKQIAQGGLKETIALTRDTTANVINTKAIASKAGPGMQSHQASDGIEHRVGDGVVTMTPDSIKLTFGPSTIVINANGIYLDGPVIHLNRGSAQSAEQALALEWAAEQATIAKGLASPDPATRAAAAKLASSLKAQQLAKLADHVYHPNDPPPTGWKRRPTIRKR